MGKESSLSLIRWFKDITLKDTPVVGGKTASLGEMYRNLQHKQVPVPNGFGIVADAYWLYLEHNRLRPKLEAALGAADWQDPKQLQAVGQSIRTALLDGEMPPKLATQILEAYGSLSEEGSRMDVAVRSSATAEDLPQASFAGQQETFLNVRGDQQLLHACKHCFASLFTDRAISYRRDMGFDHFAVALSIAVQRMIRSDLAASGVMFSIDTETGFRNVVLVNASYGLGENVVQGTVNPDEFRVFKPTLPTHRPILQKRLGSKEVKLVYDVGGNRMVRNVPVSPEDRGKFSISDDEILQLARWGCAIEDHYSQLHDRFTPMDMEWAKDGLTGELWILQARPETVHSQKKGAAITVDRLLEKGRVLVEGRSVGDRIGQGRIRVIHDVAQLGTLQDGEILVTDKTDPDWEPVMKRAHGIVTNRGGRTCHAAIVSRELGLPAIVGTENGTEKLQTGQEATISCAEGEIGRVYEGRLRSERSVIDVVTLERRPRTKIMMNLANPDEAFHLSLIPNDGVGLARIEFIIANQIKVHPMALIHYDRITDPALRQQIDKLTQGFAHKPDYFVETLKQGVGMLAAAFFPHDVIVRFSDFKTNEYSHLIGGQLFETEEANPMLGFRGASRYYHERYRQGFALECEALRKVRDEMGLTNVKVMIPFCRTLDEAHKVLGVMEEAGFKRGANGLEVYVMCEIPSNVILAADFAQLFDGFSIGSNDLTQLTLGVDRDSEILAPIFDERNAAVKALIRDVIKKAKAAGSKIGICGQAPSDYPDFAAYLVQEGIDSISLNPDSVVRTTLMIQNLEQGKEGKT